MNSRFDFLTWQSATDDLVARAFHGVHTLYRIGGANALPYHSLFHTIDVASAAETLASAMLFANGEAQSGEYLYLAKIAGAFHDLEQTQGTAQNEILSADKAVQAMDAYPVFTSTHKALVRDAILSTTIDTTGGVFRQMLVSDHPLCQIIADADLAYLGMPTAIFRDRMERLYAEWHPQGSTDEYISFIELQRRFLRAHRFHTSEADVLFPHKAENIGFVDNMKLPQHRSALR